MTTAIFIYIDPTPLAQLPAGKPRTRTVVATEDISSDDTIYFGVRPVYMTIRGDNAQEFVFNVPFEVNRDGDELEVI